MKNRSKDIPYCGVREDVIKVAKPTFRDGRLEMLKHWIAERYAIHIRKDVEMLPKPWSEEEIFQKVKFTNVFRENDRTTVWLIDHVCNADISLYEKIFNIVLFRLYNKFETAEILGLPLKVDFNLEEYSEKVNAHSSENEDYVWFTGAFNTGGLKRAIGWKYGTESCTTNARPLLLMHNLVKEGFFKRVACAKDAKEVCDVIQTADGIGQFLGYQMFVDFTYCPEYHFSENEFTICGPGCRWGLDELFADTDGMTPEECLFWLRDNQDEVFGFDPEMFVDREEHDKKLNVMCLENCFCEFSKYVRMVKMVEDGKSPRGRVNFDGVVDSSKPKTKSVRSVKTSEDNRTIPYNGKRITQEEADALSNAMESADNTVYRKEMYTGSLFEDKPEYVYPYHFDGREQGSLFQLLGTNGSGKSTIPKGVVGIDKDAYLLTKEFTWLAGNMTKGYEVARCKKGFATVCPNLGIILIGDYTPGENIAGCDTLVQATMLQALNWIEEQPEFKGYHILMEGVVLSSSVWHIEWFKERGVTPHLMFMDTPIEVCMQRLIKRNAERGKEPNTKNVEGKFHEMWSRRERMLKDETVKVVDVDHTMDIPSTVDWFMDNFVTK